MNITLNDIITNAGHTLKRKTATEAAGPCPWCGGKDRFIISTEKQRYWCRGCNRKGDAIQFLRDYKGMTFKEAALILGRELTSRSWQPLQRKAEAKTTWTPRTITAPGGLGSTKPKECLKMQRQPFGQNRANRQCNGCMTGDLMTAP